MKPTPAAKPPPPARTLDLQGHRGCRGLRPENTLAGFRHAISLGVNTIELDLGLTRDGVLVVAHDPALNPVICKIPAGLPSQRIMDLTFEQLQALDCGSLKNPRFEQQTLAPGEKMPRLEQVLDLLRQHPRLRANIEIKTFGDRPEQTRPPADFARALAALLKDPGIKARVTVQSFDRRALLAVAAEDPRLTLAALADRRADMEPLLKATGARIISPRYTVLRKEDVAAFRRRGIKVIPWTVNELGDMMRLLSWGVDGIITDYPDRLLSPR